MGFKDQMKEHDEQFERDKVSGGVLPDGSYDPATITEARVDHDDSDDTYTMVFKFEAEQDIAGQKEPVMGGIRKWYNLDHEVGRSICAQDMRRLGYEGKLSGLEKACKDEVFIGMQCAIKVQTKPGDERDFTNVYINKVHGKGEVPAGVGAAADADDDIPFAPTGDWTL